ncbi:MAG TPA: hypothetical protein VEC16_06395 [Alphaproteobacteria bacterium]|nr:hypothetical protein [Alphaproteobacteria bacterium]
MKTKETKSKENNFLKYTTTVSRILLGAIFVFFGFGYFFMPMPPLDMETKAGQFAAGLAASVYFMPFLKIVEGIAGLMLLFRRWNPLALIILAPIVLNILLYDIFVDTRGLAIGIVIVLLTGFLVWRNWDKYAGLFKA